MLGFRRVGRAAWTWLQMVGVEARDRTVDILSILLISVATVLSAWCGYEAARWSGNQALHYNQASAYRFQSAAAADQARLAMSIDIGLFVRIVDAYFAGRTDLTEFMYARLRPEMLPAMKA